MKNYVMTKNYTKTFKIIAIVFLVMAVITAIVIPLSLSQQISDASRLKADYRAYVREQAEQNPGDFDDDDYDDYYESIWKSQITPLNALNYIIIGAAIVLWAALLLVYWLNIVAWLYKSAVNEKMNKSLWPILGVFFNILAVAAFCIVRDRPRKIEA